MKKFIVVMCMLGSLFVSARAWSGDSTPFEFSVFSPAQLTNPEKDVAGVRIGLLYGMNENLYGLDFGIGLNDLKGEFAGVQLAFLANRTHDGLGFQAAFGCNFVGSSESGSLKGIQMAGLGNRAKSLRGLQLGTIYNGADTMKGLQFGLVNIANDAKGVQFGLLNWTRTMRGVQIGLVNIIIESNVKFLPLINAHF